MKDRALGIAQPSARQLLARLLDDPELLSTVQALEPRSLGRLIRHVGLEDCGEIVSLATTEQIERVFDDDLWTSERPGEDETFDVARFGLWLEVMLEAGEDFAAEKLAELPEDLVTFALHGHILVVDTDELRAEMDGGGDDAELTDKALESSLYQEIDEYQVISRRHDGWDAILAILLALDRRDHALLQRILARSCALSREYIEDNGGLYDVLGSSEMLEDDVAADREERRAREGFVAPPAATAFLKLARATPPGEVMAKERDAVTRAYFREVSPARGPAGARRARALTTPDASAASRASEIEAILGELEAAEIERAAPSYFLLAEGRGEEGASASLFSGALAALAIDDAEAHRLRLDEIAYLCNVLVAGCAFDGRAFRPVEAVVAVAAACNLGLERALQSEGTRPVKSGADPLLAARTVARAGADKIFRVGYHLLHEEIAMAACAALARATEARMSDAEDSAARNRMTALLERARSAAASGRPWQARAPLEQLEEIFDEQTTAALLGLLGEYPFLTAKLEKGGSGRYRIDRRRRFLATKAEIGGVRSFLRRL